MNLIIGLHHILLIFVILGGGIWAIFKFWLSNSIARDLKDEWKKELTLVRTSIEDKKEKEIKEIKKTIDKDYENLNTLIRAESSTEAIKRKVSDYVDGEFKLVMQDLKQIKESSNDMRALMTNQQETLIAIQMNLTELKPRLENLENRVSNLESNKR